MDTSQIQSFFNRLCALQSQPLMTQEAVVWNGNRMGFLGMKSNGFFLVIFLVSFDEHSFD